MSKRLPIIAKEVNRNARDHPLYWMQDGASILNPKAIKELCEKHGIKFLNHWPDMNPIDNGQF
jgi:hypothetical protein